MYEILLTSEAQHFYAEADPVLVRKLNRCFQYLQNDPYKHPNIKRLKGPLAGYLRYRVGDWRVIYQVREPAQEVIVVLITHRSEVYR
jgi:mRNA interferase RelE/StbE